MGNSEITFIHTADLHLDAPLHGLHRIHADVAKRLQECQRQTFEHIINLCMEHNADFLVISGDLFDTNRRNIRTQVVLKEQFERLNRRGIRVFLAAGNHDNLAEADYKGAGMEITLPENVHVFSGDAPDEIVFDKNGEPAARIVGISFAQRDIQANLSQTFPSRNDRLFTVGVLHTSLSGHAEHDVYAPCSTDDLISKDYDYWALGHIHKRWEVSNSPWIVYPGCPQARRRRETGNLSVSLVKTDTAGNCSVTELPSGALAMHDMDVDIAGIEKTGDLLAAVREDLNRLRRDAPPQLRGIMARVRFIGTGPLGYIRSNPVLQEYGQSVRDWLLENLRPESLDASPFMWVRDVDPSACRPASGEFDIDALVNEKSLPGDTVRLVHRAKSEPALLADLATALLESKLPESTYQTDKTLLRFLSMELERETGGQAAAKIAGEQLDRALRLCLDALAGTQE